VLPNYFDFKKMRFPMLFKSIKTAFAIIFSLMIMLPVSFGGRSAVNLLLPDSLALSSKSQPLTSNIFVEIAKKQNPAVVNVSIKSKAQPAQRNFQAPPNSDPFKDFYDKFFGEQNQKPRRGMGSGFIIDKEGFILTNYHVIEGADQIIVLLEDDKEYTAKLIGSDSKTDIALIQIQKEPGDDTTFPALKMGDSKGLEVGEWVVAIGNPFGLSHTVTVGVVSALRRSIGAGPYDEFIQTDASINPGNSGGPLINLNGEVIGINTAIISGNTGGNVGIGFAIPINIAKGILHDLKEKGTVTRGWLGVMIQKITPELERSFGLSSSEGALVGDVIPGGPAEKAGVKRGDVIVGFNGHQIKEMENLPKVVAATRPGETVEMEIVRDGKTEVVRVLIEVLKDVQEQQLAKVDPLGMQVQEITKELAQSLQLESIEGVLVSDVTAGGAAGEAGVKRGDVISEVNRNPVRNLADYKKITDNVAKGSSVLFLIRRGGSTIYIAVKVE
jgi:serine protease Do